jgi:hypothetical protein
MAFAANSLSSRIDTTQLHMVSRDKVASVAHAMLNGANRERPADLAAGAAILFAVLAERVGMDAYEFYRLGRKILTEPSPHHTKPNVQMEALRDFAGLRVRNKPLV